ncbi:MAG: hypothetical protein RKH07_12760 [Gammaproteobacteria bacterium]
MPYKEKDFLAQEWVQILIEESRALGMDEVTVSMGGWQIRINTKLNKSRQASTQVLDTPDLTRQRNALQTPTIR